ncbi:Hypothetical predicted protein, partial [Podarcis lilfordi]
ETLCAQAKQSSGVRSDASPLRTSSLGGTKKSLTGVTWSRKMIPLPQSGDPVMDITRHLFASASSGTIV